MGWTWLDTYFCVGWVIRVIMVPGILRRQFAPGAGVAWLGIIFLHPYIGLALYMAVGETRLGRSRSERRREQADRFRSALRTAHSKSADLAKAPPDIESVYESMVLQAQKISGMPVMNGGPLEFLDDAAIMVSRLIADIDAAKRRVHLLYYILSCDATGQRVAAAVERAARRGVECRVLADAVGSRLFFQRSGLARQLTEAGAQVVAALMVAPIQRRLPRMDLRNHRKLAIIDDRIAYAGSHNLIDANYGGRKGGPWFDLTGRYTGPIVNELAVVFAEDWAFETGQLLDCPATNAMIDGPDNIAMQVVPTGPARAGDTYRRVLLAAIQSARRQLILTTPYFVPDETTLTSLLMAADRGVDVRLLLPAVPDHFFTAAAGRAHFSSLLSSGVSIFQFHPGLLHAKTATVDDAFAIMGSANLDVRSFNLNFELSVLLYGPAVTARMRAIQLNYQAQSTPLDAKQWSSRSVLSRYGNSAVSLLSPLL